jgi:hypothetical protein
MSIKTQDELLAIALRVADTKTREVHTGSILRQDYNTVTSSPRWPADVYLDHDNTRGVFEVRYWRLDH